MKQTAELAVRAKSSSDEKTISIHPNDGYDIGLMTASHAVRIYAACTAQQFAADSVKHVFGTLYLRNECRIGTVEMSLRTAEKLGNTRKVRLVLTQGNDKYGKLLIKSS